jgi:predicted flap endonuclease-1-like 5' DNA nuclease
VDAEDRPSRSHRRRWLLAALAASGAWVVKRRRGRAGGGPLPTEPAGAERAGTEPGSVSAAATIDLDAEASDVISLADVPAPSAEQLEAGRALLGPTLVLDDLELIEGIGPAIAAHLREQGITTWRALSTTPVATLRDILDRAGGRFRVHDPATWPEQAGLLANGEWTAFRAFTEQHVGGRAVAPPATPTS